MDIKDLDKSQLILMTLLVSFVISIATSVTTVTLMQEVPLEIIQPINKIIRETVERTVPVEIKSVKTIIIKEEDLVVTTIEESKKALISVKQGENTSNGFIISGDGTAVVSGQISKDIELVAYIGQESFKATFIAYDLAGFSIIKLSAPIDVKNFKFPFISLASTISSKTGQTVILLYPDNISTGIYLGAIGGGEIATTTEEKPILNTINTSLIISNKQAGSPVLNTSGVVLGVVLGGADNIFILSSDHLINTLKGG